MQGQKGNASLTAHGEIEIRSEAEQDFTIRLEKRTGLPILSFDTLPHMVARQKDTFIEQEKTFHFGARCVCKERETSIRRMYAIRQPQIHNSPSAPNPASAILNRLSLACKMTTHYKPRPLAKLFAIPPQFSNKLQISHPRQELLLNAGKRQKHFGSTISHG